MRKWRLPYYIILMLWCHISVTLTAPFPHAGHDPTHVCLRTWGWGHGADAVGRRGRHQQWGQLLLGQCVAGEPGTWGGRPWGFVVMVELVCLSLSCCKTEGDPVLSLISPISLLVGMLCVGCPREALSTMWGLRHAVRLWLPVHASQPADGFLWIIRTLINIQFFFSCSVLFCRVGFKILLLPT